MSEPTPPPLGAVTAAEAGREADVARRRRFIEQWAPLSGVAFFGIFVAFLIISFSQLDTGDSLEESQRRFEAGISSTTLWASFTLLMAMTLTWLVFISELYAALRRVAAGLLSTLALAGGLGFIFFFVAGMIVWIAPLAALSDEAFAGASSRTFAETYWWLGNIGFGFIATGALCAGVMILAASALSLRYGLTRTWAGWLSVVIGAAALFTFGVFFTLFLIPLWTLATAVILQLKATRRDEIKQAAGLPGPTAGFQP